MSELNRLNAQESSITRRNEKPSYSSATSQRGGHLGLKEEARHGGGDHQVPSVARYRCVQVAFGAVQALVVKHFLDGDIDPSWPCHHGSNLLGNLTESARFPLALANLVGDAANW